MKTRAQHRRAAPGLHRLSWLAVGAAATLQAPAALAQAAAAEAETVTITAQKRKERLQDVPAAASVLTERDIERAGIANIQDAAALTPNLVIIDQLRPGIQTVSFRGFTTVQGGQSPFAIVVDGVAQPGQEFLKAPLVDVQQIEVLRGPQGTLYGAGAIAGAINIVTQPPGDRLEGRVKLGFGEGGQRSSGVSLSGPLGPAVWYRLGLGHVDFDGQIRNVTTGRNVDFSYETTLNGQLLIKPGPRLTIDLRANGVDGNNGALWLVPVTNDQFDDWSGGPVTDMIGRDKRRLQTYSAKVDYAFDRLTLTSITAVNKARQFLTADGDFSSAPIAGQTWTNDSDSVSQEFRLTSTDAGALRWNAGVFLQRYKFLDVSQFGAVQSDGSVLYPAGSDNLVRTRNDSWALFGQASYDLNTALTLTGGLRYDSVKARGSDPGSGWSDEHTFSELQPKLTAAYKLSPALMGYLTYAKGFRTGGFNPNTPLTVRRYDNEVSSNLELGLKSALLDNKLQLNAAVFATDFKNQQFFYSLATADGIYRAITNIPKTRVKGAEIDAQWRVAPWLKLAGSLGYNDTEIRRFDSGQYNGNRVPQVYGLTTNLGIETQHQLGAVQLVARLDWAHRGDVYWDLANQVRTPAKDFFNARLAFEWAGGGETYYQLALVGKNLTDERTPAAVGANALGAGRSLRSGNQPRWLGAELQVRF
jgi:iron complex outermembrane receptor protein